MPLSGGARGTSIHLDYLFVNCFLWVYICFCLLLLKGFAAAAAEGLLLLQLSVFALRGVIFLSLLLALLLLR